MSAMDKKVKDLMEVIPRLDEAEARRLLTKAGGSVNKATDMALEGGEWTTAAAKKKAVTTKKEDKPTAPIRRDDKPRREFVERKPRVEETKVEKKVEVKGTPATIVIGAAKSKVETGVSFADMIKRQKQQAEAVVEAVPEPVQVAAPAPEVVAEPVVVVEATEAAPVEAPKPKKEKKEPKVKKEKPLPQKYEAEIDRVSAVNLPTSILELATSTFTFSAEQGRAPSPPRPQAPQQQPQQQIHNVQHQQNEWNAPRQQVPQQPRWNQDGNQQQGYNNRNQHFGHDWRQNQRNNNGYDAMGGGYNNRNMNNNYRQDAYNNNNVMRPAQAQPANQQPQQNFW